MIWSSKHKFLQVGEAKVYLKEAYMEELELYLGI